MFEVDVKNVTEKGREEGKGREGKGRTRLGFLLGFKNHLVWFGVELILYWARSVSGDHPFLQVWLESDVFCYATGIMRGSFDGFVTKTLAHLLKHLEWMIDVNLWGRVLKI